MYPGDDIAHLARFSVHYELPATLEQYYYEACSTGPVNKPARCIMLFERADYLAQSSRAAAKDPSPAEAMQAVRAIRELEDARHTPTAEKLAQTAQLSSKKARLVATLLKDAGIVSEDDDGVLHVLEEREEAVQSATSDYRRHKDDERKRFREIVNYAESGICRQKLLLRFFGRDEIEEQCGICDNCRKGKEVRARAVTRARTRARGPDRPWSRGDLVEHDAWGEGEVKQVWGDKLRVHFPGLGEKIIKAEFVRPA
jgi:ATP-dependent DNA helicase RecQ